MSSLIKLVHAFQNLPANLFADTETATAYLLFAGPMVIILATLFTIVIGTACANTVRGYYDRV